MFRKISFFLLLFLYNYFIFASSSEIIIRTKYIRNESSTILNIYFEFFDFENKKPLNIDVIRIYQNRYNPDNLIYQLIKKNNKVNTSKFSLQDLNELFIPFQKEDNEIDNFNQYEKYIFVFLTDFKNRPTGQADWFHFPFYATKEAKWLFDDNGYYRDLFGIRYIKGFLWCKDKLIIHINMELNILPINSIVLTYLNGTIINAEPLIRSSELHFALGKKFKKGDSIFVIFPKDSFGINKQSDNLKYLFEVP